MGQRKCGLRGTPLERLGSRARVRRIRSQIPTDWRVCFCERGEREGVWVSQLIRLLASSVSAQIKAIRLTVVIFMTPPAAAVAFATCLVAMVCVGLLRQKSAEMWIGRAADVMSIPIEFMNIRHSYWAASE